MRFFLAFYFCLFSINCKSQNTPKKKVIIESFKRVNYCKDELVHASLVSFKDKELLSLLKKIIIDNKYKWFIQIDNQTGNLIVTQKNYISNILSNRMDYDNTFVTIINDISTIIFVNEEKKSWFIYNGFDVDLSKYVVDYIFNFNHLNYWIVGRSEATGKYIKQKK